MSTHMMIELVGYFGSILVLISFLMSSVVKLRVINSIGGFIFAVYAVIIQSYPTALMNFCLVGINIYYLLRLKKSDRHYDLLESGSGDSMVSYFLNHYKDDIQNCFPELNWRKEAYDTVYLVCCDANPAGILLGNRQKDGTLRIVLDYSTPTYRDCSVGEYLYSKLSGKGIRKMIFEGKAQKHEAYLKKMGFVRENGRYVKKLG